MQNWNLRQFLNILSRFSGEEPRQPSHRHHPACPFFQEQVHQADLPGWCGHGEMKQMLRRCLVFFPLPRLDYLLPGRVSCRKWLTSRLLFISCLLFSHQFLCGYQQPSTPAPKVIKDPRILRTPHPPTPNLSFLSLGMHTVVEGQ